MRFSLRTIFLFLALVGCERGCVSRSEMSAEQVVEAYLNAALNMEKLEQKQNLMSFATGALKDAIAGASDETIKAAYIDKRYSLQRFALLSRLDRTPREVEVRYHLAYKEFPEGTQDENQAVDVQTENTIVAVREDGVWYIRDVLNAQTSFDFPTQKITAKASDALAP